MRLHHQRDDEYAQETNARDTRRVTEVYQVLAAAGIPCTLGDGPAHVCPEKAHTFHAVDLHMWAGMDDDPEHPEVQALADRIDAVLWDAGYLIHREHRNPIMHAYRRDWGGDLPEIQWTTDVVAAHLGITPATWRGYVSRGQAPQADGHYTERAPWWYCSTIDAWRRDRPGQGARTDRGREKLL